MAHVTLKMHPIPCSLEHPATKAWNFVFGFSQTPGDRQSIRSYPGALISNIVRALGRKTVACSLEEVKR